MKSGSSGSKKPKLYDVAAPVTGSTTTIASWPKRSKKIVPGCIVATPMRGTDVSGAASAVPQASSHSSSASTRRGAGAVSASAVIAPDAHQQCVQAPRVRARDAEAETTQGKLLAGLGQVADRRGDQAADGVVLVVVEVGAEALVEVGDRGQRVDHVLAVGLGGDQRARVVGVVVL